VIHQSIHPPSPSPHAWPVPLSAGTDHLTIDLGAFVGSGKRCPDFHSRLVPLPLVSVSDCFMKAEMTLQSKSASLYLNLHSEKWRCDDDFPYSIIALATKKLLTRFPICSIIFIHGLAGNREKSWSHKDESVSWPEHLLPRVVRRCRILTFGYDTNDITATIRSHSEKLLMDIHRYRANDRTVCR
jgi:hypothetical protein